MDLDRMKRHSAVLTNTGVRCIVVFRKVPDDDKNCLVVETDRLPDMYHDNIIEAVNSREAQQTVDFYEILNRRVLSDGMNALQSLHFNKFLRKVPIEHVSLVPFPGQLLPLALLNAQVDGTLEEYTAESDAKTASDKLASGVIDPNDPSAVARGLLLEAEMLDNEAIAKRQKAYELAPELIGGDTPTRGRPKLTPEERAERAIERKAKRKARDQQNAAVKKAGNAEDALTALVDAKILRDASETGKKT